MIPTGLEGLDSILGGGLPLAQVTLLCAPPAVGKTSMALDWAIFAARHGVRVVVWSLELPAPLVLARLTSIETCAPWGKVLRGDCQDDVADAGERLRGLDLHLVTEHGAAGAGAVRGLVAEAAPGQSCLVAVDYLQLLSSAGGDPRAAAEWASEWTATLAKDAGCAVLAISSTSRAAYKLGAEGEPEPADILSMARDSGRLEFDAAVVIGIVPIGPAQDDRFQREWIVVGKSRLGPVGKLPVMADRLRGTVQEIDPGEMGQGLSDARVTAEIISAISKAEGLGEPLTSQAQLRQRVGARNNAITAALRRLLADGRVIGGAGKPYRLPGVEVGP